MVILSSQVNEHCKNYKGCIKCPFVGNECVAPVQKEKFKEWIIKMENLIKDKNEAN